MLTVVARKWWVLLLNGICGIIFGLMAFAWPGITVVALVILFGAYCLADGITAVTASLGRDEKGKSWGQMLFIGLISIGAGITALVWPGITAMILLFVIAFWAIVRGITEIVAAIELRKVIQNEWLLILAGAVSVLFGVILIAHPGAGALAVIWVIGAFALLRGLLLVTLAFKLRGHHRHAIPSAASAEAK